MASHTSEKREMLGNAMLLETKDLHKKVEKLPYVLRMVESRITRNQYRLLMVDLYYVYEALEEEVSKLQDDPVYGPMYCPDELNRVEALEKDLNYFFGEGWKKLAMPTKASQDYVEYIHRIGNENPFLLLAHAFVKYMGDLTGGQILKHKLPKCMGLPATGEGVKYYHFDKVESAVKFKNFLMARVNNLEVDREMYDRLIQESRYAFELNINILEVLEPLAERMGIMENPPKNIMTFEKILQASTVILSFAVIYTLFRSFTLASF